MSALRAVNCSRLSTSFPKSLVFVFRVWTAVHQKVMAQGTLFPRRLLFLRLPHSSSTSLRRNHPPGQDLESRSSPVSSHGTADPWSISGTRFRRHGSSPGSWILKGDLTRRSVEPTLDEEDVLAKVGALTPTESPRPTRTRHSQKPLVPTVPEETGSGVVR